MYLINLTKNRDGSYPPIQYASDNTILPGTAEFPARYYNVFYPQNKRAAGFVVITVENNVVASCEWDESAYQAWCEANPEQPEQEPVPTLDERVTTLEGDTAELHEALDMILTGVTE